MRLIDADALLNDPANISSNEFGDDVVYVEDINKAPTVERPHGKWIYHKEWEIDGECAYECSRCGMGADVDYNFCQNCGASMQANDRQVIGKLNSEIEKTKIETKDTHAEYWDNLGIVKEGEAE